MDYAVLKAVHVGAVTLSLTLFLVRGAWMLAGSQWLQQRWVKVLPHLVDTVLLASAVWLAFRIGQAPLRDGWLTAKVAGLLVYIVLGSIALKRGRTPAVRRLAFAAALASFAYIVSVALTKRPFPWT
ncbi:MAG: SirB2 family protein [Burkholderiales bacterium]|nr:SirB2 family protein [Burkholderiales bacterium]